MGPNTYLLGGIMRGTCPILESIETVNLFALLMVAVGSFLAIGLIQIQIQTCQCYIFFYGNAE